MQRGRQRRRVTGAVALVGALTSLALGGTAVARPAPVTHTASSTASATPVKGGTLDVLVNGVIDHLDPQRQYTGVWLADFSRMVYRSLVTYPSLTPAQLASHPGAALRPVPDLATSTGTSSNGARTWRFTLKSDVTWQDGTPITCGDLKYGVERSFATDVITGGPNYALSYVDAPHYRGPYRTSQKGTAEINKAITCSADNRTITYHFDRPWSDFPLALASLQEFDPYRRSHDRGDRSNYVVDSDGPYELQGTWNPDRGGTFVRNPHWSDDTSRQANPDMIVFKLGYDPATETAVKTVLADKDPDAIIQGSAAGVPADQFSAAAKVSNRTTQVASPFTNYLVPNFKRLKNAKVRRALALATDRAAYSRALGGSRLSRPARSIVNPSVPGYTPVPGYAANGKPNDAKAHALLRKAHDLHPRIVFTFPLGSSASNNAFAALAHGWKRVGFKVVLHGLDPASAYYPTIQNPDARSDLTWGGWGADWPSVDTVLPPLFDSRVNLGSSSNGQDYGNYADAAINKEFDRASTQTNLDTADHDWTRITKQLGAQTAFIPLDDTFFYTVRGSNVTTYATGPASSNYADLGVISLADPTK